MTAIISRETADISNTNSSQGPALGTCGEHRLHATSSEKEEMEMWCSIAEFHIHVEPPIVRVTGPHSLYFQFLSQTPNSCLYAWGRR